MTDVERGERFEVGEGLSGAAALLEALAEEASEGETALAERVRAALEALEGERAAAAARGETLSAARALVRDVIAEELERYWERRFGGRP